MKKSIQDLLSVKRLEGYRGRSSNEDDSIVQRYNYNIEVSQFFYPSLHILEIAVRNILHSSFSIYFKDPDWLRNHTNHSLLQGRENKKISEAIFNLQKKNKPLEEGRIIAELNFGFWVNLYDRPYLEVHKATIKTQYPNASNPQRNIVEIKRKLSDIRNLRNRVFHYEPIWHWTNLELTFNEIKDLICWTNEELLLKCFVDSELKLEGLFERQENMLK